MNVCDLITMASNSNLYAGAVLDFRPEINGLENEIKRLELNKKAGCRFIVTQSVYDMNTAAEIASGVRHLKLPVILGILPLLSCKHAWFLDEKVMGIAVPASLIKRMESADSPAKAGIQNARDMLALARKMFSGTCIMPPFNSMFKFF